MIAKWLSGIFGKEGAVPDGDASGVGGTPADSPRETGEADIARRIAVIDIPRVRAVSLAGKRLRAELEGFRGSMQARIDDIASSQGADAARAAFRDLQARMDERRDEAVAAMDALAGKAVADWLRAPGREGCLVLRADAVFAGDVPDITDAVVAAMDGAVGRPSPEDGREARP